ncbi:MAG TPA: hypothetical protein VMW91_00590 [Desulfosporosinus sp.]|nr:hypothetical protein [Desulfosporosinus sp.]
MTISAKNVLSYLGISKRNPPNVFRFKRNPKESDNSSKYSIGDLWINSSENSSFILTGKEDGSAQWGQTSTIVPGGEIDLLGSDSGIATPVNAKVDIKGTAAQGVSTTGSANKIEITVANATTTTKGVAQFDTSDFNVSSGNVSLKVTPVSELVGTFTPKAVGSAVAGTGTYDIQLGNFIKIGRLVHVDISLSWSAHTGSGNMIIDDLPYTALNTTNYFANGATVFAGPLAPSSTDNVTASLQWGTKAITFFASRSGSEPTPINIGSNQEYYVSMSYLVD